MTLFTTTALAQPLVGERAGFGRKQKITAPTPGLAERLEATVVPVPKNRAGLRSLTATGGPRVSAQPLRLRVVRDSATGLPIYIEQKPTGRTPTSALPKAGARLSAAAAASAAYQFMGQVRGLLKVADPEANFTVS